MSRDLTRNQANAARDDQKEGLAALTSSLRAGFKWLYALILAMLVAVLAQSFFIVKQHEMGVIYRFGTLRDVVEPGLWLTWPYPIEQTETYPFSRSQRVEANGFMAAPRDEGQTDLTLRPGVDGYLLTADMNVIHVSCRLTYSLSSDRQVALNYFLRSAEREKLLTALFDNAIVQAASELTADDVLFHLDKFRGRVASALRRSTRDADLGISFETNDISLSASPPAQAKSAFDALNQAGQRGERSRNEALSFRIKTESEAKREAARVRTAAESEAARRVAAAKADAAVFSQRLKQYLDSPELVSRSLYEEALFSVFENVDEKFVVDREDHRELRLLLSRSLDKRPDRKKTP